MIFASDLVQDRPQYSLIQEKNINTVLFNSKSNHYTCDIFDSRLPFESLVLAQSVDFIDEPQNVLDVGTGTGIILLEICKKRRLSCGLGIDTNSKKINKAFENIQNNGFGDLCKVQCCSFQNLSKDDLQIYQYVTCNPPLIPEEYGFWENEINNGKKNIIPMYCSFIEWCYLNLPKTTKIYMHIFDYIDTPTQFYSSFSNYANTFNYVTSVKKKFFKEINNNSQVYKSCHNILKYYPESMIWYNDRELKLSDYISMKGQGIFYIECSILLLERSA